MEPPGGVPPDRDKLSVVHQQPNINTPTTQQNSSLIGVSTAGQQGLERLSRPMAFDKMECLVREMQDPENGVPVRQQKMFLTSIPYAFMGYDLIEWLMDRLSIEESEALSIANQLCLHGYFFPVNDTKTLVVKDDSSLYRFQTPYYWPWQHKAPDNVEYAIYLAKRSLRNKQRHGLEDYESDALASLHKNLKGKWDFISMQAEEQVRLAKERKKGDKIVGDSQERAYWRVHRPPPGLFTPLEPCPVPSRDRQGIKPRKRTVDDWQREVDYLTKSLSRTRMKMSQACESLVNYWETFTDYDFFLQPVLPSNPWVSEDTTFWQLNNAIVDIPTEKRVKRWAISIEELVSDPTGLQEFTTFLEKEYSHENIRFWIAVNRLRRSAHSQVAKKVNEIYEEFLKPGAPCEINIDGKTMEIVQKGLKNPSRFTFDAAAEHIYMLLLKKDCYPRFIRSEHYKSLLASGIQPSHKKRFFGFGGVAKKKISTVAAPNQALLAQATISGVPAPGTLSRRRGSDRSLTGSAHELAIIGVKDASNKVPHSHSQSNLSEIPYSVTVYRGDMPTDVLVMDVNTKDTSALAHDDTFLKKSIQEPKPIAERLEATAELGACSICPWETPVEMVEPTVLLSVCPWEESQSPRPSVQARNAGTSSDISEVSERMRRSCGLRQNTVDSDYSTKRLMPNITEQRRASMTMASRVSDFQFALARQSMTRASTTPSPTSFTDGQDKTNAITTLAISEECTSNDNRDETIDDKCEKCESKIIDLKIDNSVNNNNKQQSEILNLNTDIIGEKISSMSQGATPTIHIVCPIGESAQDTNELLSSGNNDNDNDNQNVDENDDTGVRDNQQQQQQEEDFDNNTIETKEIKERSNLQKLEIGRNESKSQISGVTKNDADDETVAVEELSPTTEEYQECSQFGEQVDDYDYEIEDVESNLTPGCVAPAPTPAPSLAPLAEIETDPVDDDQEQSQAQLQQSVDLQKAEGEETKKRRKKRDSDSKKVEDKPDGSTQPKDDEANCNAVCPWEDEDVTTTSDAPFVKTYATLGYL